MTTITITNQPQQLPINITSTVPLALSGIEVFTLRVRRPGEEAFTLAETTTFSDGAAQFTVDTSLLTPNSRYRAQVHIKRDGQRISTKMFQLEAVAPV